MAPPVHVIGDFDYHRYALELALAFRACRYWAGTGCMSSASATLRSRTNSSSRVGLAAGDEHNPDQAKHASSHQLISESLTVVITVEVDIRFSQTLQTT